MLSTNRLLPKNLHQNSPNNFNITSYQTHAYLISQNKLLNPKLTHRKPQTTRKKNLKPKLKTSRTLIPNAIKYLEENLVNTVVEGSQKAKAIFEIQSEKGGFIVAFVDEENRDGDAEGGYAQEFDYNNKKIKDNFRINSYSRGRQVPFSVISLTNSNIWFFFETIKDESGTGIYGQLFDENHVQISGEIRINETIKGDQGEPRATLLKNDFIAITWSTDNIDGSGKAIMMTVINKSGIKISGEVMVNTGDTNDDQEHPHIATTYSGGFIITWQSGSGELKFTETIVHSDATNTIVSGGKCLCPDGQQYDAGALGELECDNNPEQELNCIGGTSMNLCSVLTGLWTYKQVVCGIPNNVTIKAKMFDEKGNPIADQFQVNTGTTFEVIFFI